MTKTKLSILALLLLSASCNPFSKTVTMGMVKTVNGGVDWQAANTLKPSGSLLGQEISSVGFEPNHRNVVFAGSYTGGLYKSDDSGDSWSRILSKISVYDFVVNPMDTKVIYVAGTFADHGKVLVTKDGGITWQDIYNEASAGNAVRTIALNPNNPGQVVIGLLSGSVIKSFDGGLSWSLLKDFKDRMRKIRWQNGDLYILLNNDGLFKTSDAGLTLTNLTINATNSGLIDSPNLSNDVSYNQLYVDPGNAQLMYMTTDHGLYKSANGGMNWIQLILPIKTDQNELYALAVAPSSSNVVVTSIGSTIYKSTDGGGTWQTQAVATTGMVNYILIDPELPQIMYAGISEKP